MVNSDDNTHKVEQLLSKMTIIRQFYEVNYTFFLDKLKNVFPGLS